MTSQLPFFPFDPERFIGTVTEVSPTSVKVNLPKAATSEAALQHGGRVGAGEVGEFVVIECGETGVFGRIVNVRLPERERLGVEPKLGHQVETHPVGTIQLLTSFHLRDGVVARGITRYPRLGSRVYSAHALIIKWIAESSHRIHQTNGPLVLNLANLPSANDTSVAVTPEHLFGRHCAVVGATGGGKSWTLARMIEEVARHSSKLLLFDATGEFHSLSKGVTHVYLGADPTPLPADSKEVVFPYNQLTESDLFGLFKPSGQVQAPKLRAAMKSLKLAKLESSLASNGIIFKAGRDRKPYDDAYIKHASSLENPFADFDLSKLPQQIDAECIWPNDLQNPTKWGRINEQDRNYSISLITRIEDILQSKELSCVLKPGGKEPLSNALDAFLDDAGARVLRVSLRYLPFAHNAREIVANAIGRFLLSKAREGKFPKQPFNFFP